jgi:membrane protease subunit (stomatin/prohibitin family)
MRGVLKSGSPPTVGALPPGRYPLSTENIPFSTIFITSFTGGNIFQAEVFFVKNQPIRNLTFGGQMMSMRDPERDLRVTPRAYGTYSMVVVDPIRFIIGYTGQAAQGDNEQITSWLRQRLFQGLGKTLGGFLKSGQTTFMDLGGVAPDLAVAMARDCPDFGEIGVRVLEIGELKISVSDEDQARIDALQDQMAEAKLSACMAKVVDLPGRSRSDNKSSSGSISSLPTTRATLGSSPANYQNYAVGKAMMGAGAGMAKGAQRRRHRRGGSADGGRHGHGWLDAANAAACHCASRASGRQDGAPSARPVPPGKFCQECGGPLAVALPNAFAPGAEPSSVRPSSAPTAEPP